jgi:hypothetical protein
MFYEAGAISICRLLPSIYKGPVGCHQRSPLCIILFQASPKSAISPYFFRTLIAACSSFSRKQFTSFLFTWPFRSTVVAPSHKYAFLAIPTSHLSLSSSPPQNGSSLFRGSRSDLQDLSGPSSRLFDRGHRHDCQFCLGNSVGKHSSTCCSHRYS